MKENIKEIESVETKETEIEDKEFLNSLPEWSIEPPIEIKRGEE